MKDKKFILRDDREKTASGAFSAEASRYDIGASLSRFVAGESAVIILEGVKNSDSSWETIATITLDDDAEVSASSVAFEHQAVRARVVSRSSKAYINVWIREAQQ